MKFDKAPNGSKHILLTSSELLSPIKADTRIKSID